MVKEFQDKQVLIWNKYGEEYIVVDEDDDNFYCYGDDFELEVNDLKMLEYGVTWYEFAKLTKVGKDSIIKSFELYDEYKKLNHSN